MRVLSLDLGTSSVRARVYDEHGQAIEGVESQTPYEPTEGVLDADLLVDAARGAVDEALREHGAPVDASGISCFWHSLLALDARNAPLSPVFTWRDLRSSAQALELRERLDGAQVHARTGCVLHPSYWPAKLAWLRETEPETFAAAARFVSFPDYLFLQLTGELRSSLSQASATGLWRTAGGWDEELLDVLGLDDSRLPPVSDEPVRGWHPALGDGACSNVGAGADEPGRAALMVGTSGALRVIRPDDGTPPRPGLFLYRLDASRLVEGGSLSDGGNLYAWLERTLRLPEGLDVSTREPDAHGLTFLTLLGGERSPGWNPDARGAISGLTLESDPADIAQAALEGVAYRFAEIADLLPGVVEVVATGAALGLNRGWAQVLADVLGRPVHPGEPEGSARGAAVVVLERLGIAVPAPRLANPFVPRPERQETYRFARERQRNLYLGVT